MRNNAVKEIALGGMLAAVALVIMWLGGLIPLSTFICPMLATLTGFLVFRFCGKKIAWCWYIAVAILSMLLSPDKEAAMVFMFLGYYPFLKPQFDKIRFGWVCKFLLFNAAIFVMYVLILRFFGMSELANEYAELGFWGGILMLVLGNITFFVLDKLLAMLAKKLK